MNQMHHLLNHLSLIEESIDYCFQNRDLLCLAFVHRSYINEDKNVNQHNERLEFLGDSILGMIITDYLYRQLPGTPEGILSNLRSRVVDAGSCANFVKKLEISSYILMGKGERTNSGKGRESILADLFEAIIGAIYLDGGLEATKRFLFYHFGEEIKKIIENPTENWKALLQDYCQKTFQMTPRYELIEALGPDHKKIFEISVGLNGKELGKGTGESKKEAQQSAAQNAFSKLKPS